MNNINIGFCKEKSMEGFIRKRGPRIRFIYRLKKEQFNWGAIKGVFDMRHRF